MGEKGGPWDTKLLECCVQPTLCALSVVFPGCQLAHQKAILNYSDCGIVDAVVLCALLPCCAAVVRSQIRMKYGLRGTAFEDAATGWCCTVCAISQQHRQLMMHGDRPQGMC